MKTRNFPEKQNNRRLNVIARLELQLEAGTKKTKEGIILLTKEDINRIEKELKILNNRINMSSRTIKSKKRRGLN
jgi:hypothetical protein